MMKTVIVLDGNIINVGEWDYQYVEIDGESVARNPLPEGAIIEERDMTYDEERGWYEIGSLMLPSEKERLDMLENMILIMMEG